MLVFGHIAQPHIHYPSTRWTIRNFEQQEEKDANEKRLEIMFGFKNQTHTTATPLLAWVVVI